VISVQIGILFLEPRDEPSFDRLKLRKVNFVFLFVLRGDHFLDAFLRNLPKLDNLIVGCEDVEVAALGWEPLDLIELFLDILGF